jgi:hypothetical protein
MLDGTDVVRLLCSEVERAGSQSAWARRERIDRTMLNRFSTVRGCQQRLSSRRSSSVMSTHWMVLKTGGIDALIQIHQTQTAATRPWKRDCDVEL